MQKQGQIAIFLVIAALLLVTAFFIIKTETENTEVSEFPESEQITSRTIAIQRYVETCMKDVATDALYQIAMHGGYLYPSGIEKYNEPGDKAQFQNYYYHDNIKHPYVLINVMNNLRPLEEIEQVLSNYVAVELPACINTFAPFTKQGIGFQHGPLTLLSDIRTEMGRDKTMVTMHWPLTITDEATTTIETFRAEIPLRFGLLYDITSQMLTDIASNQPFHFETYCKSYLEGQDLINVYVESNPYAYNYLIRVIDGAPTKQDQLPLRFQYAVKNLELYGECVG